MTRKWNIRLYYYARCGSETGSESSCHSLIRAKGGVVFCGAVKFLLKYFEHNVLGFVQGHNDRQRSRKNGGRLWK